MKKVVGQVQPDLIHLNTVVRPPSEDWVKPLSQKEMESIRVFFGEKASVISEFDRHLLPVPGSELVEEILRILRRRPLSLTDLSKGMGISEKELEKHIEPLVKKGRIRSRHFGGLTFYEI
jgi:wyosine [tRNA(Phe)-imidazoG37] synthetase (radical SAM superfamily)